MKPGIYILAESQLPAWVAQWALTLQGQEFFLLQGPVGAGKTTFVRYLAQSLGIFNSQSPTYALHQRYLGATFVIDHYDLYRMQDEQDLMSTGFFDQLQESGLICIEWSDSLKLTDLPMGRKGWLLTFNKILNQPHLRELKVETFQL